MGWKAKIPSAKPIWNGFLLVTVKGLNSYERKLSPASSRGEQNVLVIPDGNLTVKRGPIHLKVLQILEEDGTERPVFRQQKW